MDRGGCGWSPLPDVVRASARGGRAACRCRAVTDRRCIIRVRRFLPVIEAAAVRVIDTARVAQVPSSTSADRRYRMGFGPRQPATKSCSFKQLSMTAPTRKRSPSPVRAGGNGCGMGGGDGRGLRCRSRQRHGGDRRTRLSGECAAYALLWRRVLRRAALRSAGGVGRWLAVWCSGRRVGPCGAHDTTVTHCRRWPN